MATTTWSSSIGHIIMSTCHVMFTRVILIKMYPYRVSIRLITCTSPLTAITFCQVSLNPMAVPKPILLHLKRRPQRKCCQWSQITSLASCLRGSSRLSAWPTVVSNLYQWCNLCSVKWKDGCVCRRHCSVPNYSVSWGLPPGTTY